MLLKKFYGSKVITERCFNKFVSRFIINKDEIQKYSCQQLAYDPIFIVGAPRTGSTVLYQLITNAFDVLYIDNLAAKWYMNLYYGFHKSIKRFGHTGHNCFDSDFGDTKSGGLHAPAECGEFWYQWLPRHKHFIDSNEVSDSSLEEIRQVITAVINRFNRPLIFKNLNAGQRMKMIKEIFPNAKFIFVTRDPYFTAQSILKAKRSLGIPDNQFWSIMPKNIEFLKELTWYEQICGQVFYLEKQIREDSNLFNDVLIVKYENLVSEPADVLETIKDFADLHPRKIPITSIIKGGNTVSLNATEREQINKEFERLREEECLR
jgi:hypothetical protein